MPRKKKKAPNRSDDRFEVKVTVGTRPDGSLIRKSFYSTISKTDAAKQAEEWKINHQAQNMLGENLNAPTECVTLSDWANRWLEYYKKDRVKVTTFKSSYERPVRLYIIPFFKDTLMENIKPIDVMAFYRKLEPELSQSFCNKVSLCLTQIFDTAISNGIIRGNPCTGLVIKSQVAKNKKRVYSEEQVAKLIKFAEHHKYGLYIRILLDLGLRCEELLGLRWDSDFDWEKGTVHIQRTVVNDSGQIIVADNTKSATSNRVLPLTKGLKKQLVCERQEQGYLQESTMYPGRPLSNKAFTQKRYNTFFKDFQKYIKDPTFPILTPHELRHTCGTLLYRRTHDIYATSKFLGHASIDITSKLYVHSDVDSLRESLNIQ